MSGTKTSFRCAIAAAMALALIVVAPAAKAQVPPLPGAPPVPALPPEVKAAIESAQGTLVPVVVQGATLAYPAVNAVGFTLRPACAMTWVTVLVLPQVTTLLPISPSSVLQPIYIVCGASSAPGPADAVFWQVDAAAGKQLKTTLGPVLTRLRAALDPARPQLTDACGAIALVKPSPYAMPPPLHRFDLIAVLCAK